MIARLTAMAGLAIFALCRAFGQPSTAPAFEVASIKPSQPDQPGMGMSTARGRLLLRNVTLKFCIEAAYKLQDFQLSGGPKWLDSDHYDIEGKTATAASFDELIGMLKTLLADRFQLQFHRETGMAPGYALVVARGGPKLKDAETAAPGGLGMGRGMVNGRSQPVSGLAEALSRTLGRPVVDETELKGKYDFRMTWTPSDTEPVMQKPGAMPSDPAEARAADNTGPSVFAAIQEQLGLKLEARRVPVEVVLVDRAEKPSQN